MKSTRPPTRRRTWPILTAATTAVLAGVGPTAPHAGAAAPRTQEIASSVLGRDYRITLTAVRSTDDAYAASVRLRVDTYGDGGWTESDRATVGAADGWFWYPLTGEGAVCRFSTSAAEPAPVDVSLLVTPSIGCSEPQYFVIEDGRIHT
ncbi:hypothetical protein [Streptomyces sp. CRN 30]|uniref:hypothetical protein n=1 Tax=Streptomyces sp. CRN 30 TaxID=3075613 RepID=UPI002A81BE64|nr:hypothetical protein [Streptomyces sp. CRN 30]